MAPTIPILTRDSLPHVCTWTVPIMRDTPGQKSNPLSEERDASPGGSPGRADGVRIRTLCYLWDKRTNPPPS
ncbi:hypothetical protein GCM10010359_53320 [Streptomyces morookaense]|nr:hypothetical protein GCM10010359_53320 [Streptomyces morookaense]